MQLPSESVLTKSLINMKNGDNECFRRCHAKHLNSAETNPQRTKKTDKQFVDKLDYSGVDFPVSLKHYNNKIEKQNDIKTFFSYENKEFYPLHISKETFEDEINLLLISDDNKSHYVLIKDFN